MIENIELDTSNLTQITTALSGIVLGIDASNLRDGGGRTHLIELLTHAKPEVHGIDRVVVWGSDETLSLLPDYNWLIKRKPPALERSLIIRSLWQIFRLSSQVRLEGCHVLFVPGGSYVKPGIPVVTMSRNMLPFEWSALRLYGFSFRTLRLLLLRYIHSHSFKNAEGVIFLTDYAAREVQRIIGSLSNHVRTIPHGLNKRFKFTPKKQEPIVQYNPSRPYRLLYVSIVDFYKHQPEVVEAVATLRQKYGWPLVLDLVGPYYPQALVSLRKVMTRWDPSGTWIFYHGSVPYTELYNYYTRADLGVFASSCENMPNILLEKIGSCLPLASSNRGPMPEILEDAGLLFDPENPVDIATKLEYLISDPYLRTKITEKCYAIAKKFTWEACSNETFTFLADVYRNSADLESLSTS